MIGLLAVAGAWFFWPHGRVKTVASHNNSSSGAAPVTGAAKPSTPSGAGSAAAAAASRFPTLNTNKLAFRLANTTNSIRQLESNPHAILLANAFIDTDKPLNLNIPSHLRSNGDPHAYIVQARGATDGRFRAVLQEAGAEIVSYIPNNAYLVNLSANGASALAGNGLVQAVLPYEPYYKLQYSLLGAAVSQQSLPPGTALSLVLNAADEAAAEQQIEDAGARIIGRDQSPFGPVVRVLASANWTALAQLPVVRNIEPLRQRRMANDLSRVTVGITPDTLVPITNDWMGLQGKNVLVAVNDSGVDSKHPDFTLTGTAESGPSGATRVTDLGWNPIDLLDTNGHGTHVAGIIAGNGSESWGLPGPLGPGPNVGLFAEGSVSNADFRGKAPFANLYSLAIFDAYGNANGISDYQIQTNSAMVGALISNNSWDNGDADYDLTAASYDAATRDAMPFTPGSQPVLFVFPSGNSGGGNDDGQQGAGDTIMSPGTAKNVITVGALQQLRNITNLVTAPDGTSNQYWLPGTQSSTLVASYSSRGNVGIGTEGASGRFKPDLVSPGTFVVSTRSSEWDTNAYYNVTNDVGFYDADQTVTTNFPEYYNVSVPENTVAVIITIIPNNVSPSPFPTNIPIYCQQSGYPDPVNAPGAIDIISNNVVTIPAGNGNCTIPLLQGNGFDFAIGDPSSGPINYDLSVQVLVTNDLGNLEVVLEGMNDQLAPYYRYESGTSLAAADVSGVLALIQDYLTNTLSLIPSPALMKALLINGTRSIPGYKPAVTNGINFEGWGLDNIQDCVPVSGLTYQPNTLGSTFFVDQSVTNSLATGDSHTYTVTLNTNDLNVLNLPLRATLVWTDPPGDPAAAIKLVNNLDLVITNLQTGQVYFGNDIQENVGYNVAWDTNGPPNLDTINNVENIFLPQGLSGPYSVTVIGRDVNVNAITAQIYNAGGQYAPNVVQDYALVVSVGEGEITNAFMVTDSGIASNPTGGQDITVVTSTNSPLFNQFAGENSPLMGTNTLPLGTNTVWGPNGVVTIGMTNQWHFYIVTNTGPTADFTNAAFITFDVSTLSVPRMGTLDPLGVSDATRPEADLDMYVSQDSNLTNLSPVTISNCLAAVSPGFGVGDGGTSLGAGGTEYVYFTNTAPGQVYYIGVKSEDREGAEYAFLPLFTDIPFSELDKNGNEIVNGLLLPTTIPNGVNAQPGVTNVFALAIQPMTIEKVTATNLDQYQNFGDLVGALKFSGKAVVLNNHDSFGNTFGHSPIVYDDTRNHPPGTTNSDGPGSLVNFRGQSALGPWILGILNNGGSGFTGQVSRLTLLIQPHRDLGQPGILVTIPPNGWFIDYVDVAPGFTNLTFYGTNVTVPVPVGAQPMQMYEKFDNEPTLTDFDQEATLTNGPPVPGPGNDISVGPPLAPGQYFIGLYNPDPSASQTVLLSARLGVNNSANDVFNYSSGSTTVLSDDAVTDGSVIAVPNTVTDLISSVNVGIVVQSPRISDYTFTLISPTGQRVLLMENRGGGDTNGAGEEFVYTNVLNSTATGGAAANTNYLPVDPLGGTVPITWNFYTVPDQMTVYDTTNPALFSLLGPYLIYDSTYTNNPPSGPGSQNTVPVTVNVPYPPGVSNITIIMNQFGNPEAGNGDAWIYTAGAPVTNYEYLEFTDNSNLTDVPIKFAQPPFNFTQSATNYVFSDLDFSTPGDYLAPTNIHDPFGGWQVPSNLVTVSTIETNGQFVLITNSAPLSNNFVSVVSDSSVALSGDTGGSNYLALAYGTITRTIPTIPGHVYNVTFWYRGPDIAGWWRGEGNALDSSDPENDNNNGALIGPFNFPAGEVGQAFEFDEPGNTYQFAGTNSYVQVPASASLDVGAGGGFTLEGWISPTNLSQPQPLFEWLSRVPTNTAITNIVIEQGPILDPATGNYYYLLGATNRTTSELWAEQMGGHLATVTTANLENWIYDTFTDYGTKNRDLWIGLAYTNSTGKFGWSSGWTNLYYTNWAPGQPFDCGGQHDENYVAIMGPTNAYPGLWQLEDDLGRTCDAPPTNRIYGVVEITNLPPIGVQFWVSATNSYDPNIPVNTNAGSLLGIIAGTYVSGGVSNYGKIFVSSQAGLLQTNVYQHVAFTFNTNTGVAQLFLNGTNVAVNIAFTNTSAGGTGPAPTNAIVPNTSGDMLLGRDLTHYTNNYFAGDMDEMSVYARALSDAEIFGIYSVSADTTNRLIGKFDPAITPAVGLAEALVTFGSSSNIIYGVNNQWEVDSFTFTATTNSMPLTISGLEPGILLDSFALQEAPETNLYYLPEQTLASLDGSSAAGDWTLQVWDNRVGGYVTNLNQLVNWQLSFVLDSNAVVSASLPPETPVITTPPAGQTVYYAVPVPAWAHEATNILVSSDQPVNLLYYSATNPPTGANPPDSTLLLNKTSGIGLPILITNGTPPFNLQPNTTYYLGVQNLGSQLATVTLEVDFDIMGLTNGVPFSDILTNEYSTVRYFTYLVSSNAYEATFQLLKLTGNADLVVSKSVPLPNLTSATYGSFNSSNADENIYVLTNSEPVPLSPGLWYLGVVNRDGTPVHYSVLAKELDNYANPYSQPGNPVVIDLTNEVPFNWTAGPGAALTNFFHFHATNSVVNGTNIVLQGLRFELYNLTGNGDLTVQTNALPLAPPFFQTSQNPRNNPELIYISTNSALTNLAGDWYLGAPNREITNISYTIVVGIETNLFFPAFPGAVGAGGGTIGAGHAGMNSTVYHVTTTADSGPGSLRVAVGSSHRTVVFDVGGTISLATPLVITNSNLTLAGQTSPGGITVAGNMTTVANAHDVIVRDIRFRSVGTVGCTTEQTVWSNGFEGSGVPATPTFPNYFAGWKVDFGSIDWLAAPTWDTYQGNYCIDLDGSNAGGVSTNVPTLNGATYALSFAYCKNPNATAPTAQLLINGTVLGTVAPTLANSQHNLNWQTTSMVFTATSPSTLVAFHSLDAHSSISGVFLDAVSLILIEAPSGVAGDSFQFLTSSNVIADHISASWSQNNLVSVLNSSNVTVQWSIMADSIYLTNFFATADLDDTIETSSNNVPDIGSLVRQGSGFLSFYHNLYADNPGGCLRLGDNLTVDFENNVAYNWQIWPVWTGGLNDLLDFSPNGTTNKLNMVCNYFIAGPDTAVPDLDNDTSFTNIAYFGNDTNALAANWIFQTNNFIDSDTNGVLNGDNTGWGMFTNDYTPFGRSFPTPPVPVDEAYQAYEKVLDFAGVAMSQRDSEDTNVVTNVRYQTGRLITSTPLVVPGIVAWWKGESNYLDNVGGNNATPENGIGFTTPGEVGTAFNLSSGQFMVANPAAPSSLDVGPGSGLTFEEWINPTTVTAEELLCEYEDGFVNNFGVVAAQNAGINFAIHGDSGGILYANLVDTSNFGHVLVSPPGLLNPNVWQHVALTYDKASGVGAIYINGAAVITTNLGSFTPLTSYTNLCMGARTLYNSVASPGAQYSGKMDEITLYGYALCSQQIAAIYNAGKKGKFASGPVVATMQPYLDTDQDGLPDFWEDTFTTNFLYVPSNNNDRDGDGYTDLEEYNNWLAAPHALTTLTNPVAVDLYQICGRSGHLAFFLTNSIHGTVYLTNVIGAMTNTSPGWSNTIAVFTPTNNASGTNYFGYASFSFYVTNLDTEAYFGPTPVSVIVSPVPILNNPPNIITPLNPGVPDDPCDPPGNHYYSVVVTANDYGAIFELEGNTGPMAMVISTNPSPSLSSFDYYTNTDTASGNLELAVVTNSTPVPLTPGTWYMTAVNENGANEVCYTALVTMLSSIQPPEFLYPTNSTLTNILETVPWSVSLVATDLDAPPLPLSYALGSGPAGLYISNNAIYWTPTEAQGPSTNPVVVSVSNGAFTVTNTFTIVVEESNLPPVLPTIPIQLIFPPNTLVVTNTATDPDIPTNALGYVLTTTVPGTNQPVIDTNGVITWTPMPTNDYGFYLFTTDVTDTNPWAVNSQSLSATNSFYVFVVPNLIIGEPGTNVVQPHSTNWFAVRVPVNAIQATNRLLFATAPVNLWYSTNVPPSLDQELLANALNGVSVLSTNLATAPTNIVPGGIYFLGVQNQNNFAVTNALRVDFELAASPLLSLPAIPDQYIAAGDTLVVTNTATDINPNAVLSYSLIDSPPGVVIATNGVITWVTATNMPPTNVVITTLVTDSGADVSVENSFHVIVLPGLGVDGPVTNIVGPNGINWFFVHVPRNADMATNILLFATAPLNMWYSTNHPPSITNATDFELLTNSIGGLHVMTTNSAPVLVPGSSYFLAVQNPNSFPVTNAVDVKFHFVAPPTFLIFSITHTNLGGSNGFLLTWYAPIGDQFHLQWTPSLAPANWTNFNGVISDASISPTNGMFQYFDDGSQTGGFGSMRFYRLLLLNSPSNTAPFFVNSPVLFYAQPGVPFVFTNSAKDWDIPPQTLIYSITNTLAGTNVTINPLTGVITWTPTLALLNMTNYITTVVVDTGVPAAGATNEFEVIVSTNATPVPSIRSISITANGVQFYWTAPTNESFHVQWATNLASPAWHVFPNTITSTTGNFTFVDTNTPLLLMKFYQLILLP